MVMLTPNLRPEGGFVDAQHGYLLLGRCPEPVNQACETWVGVTDDGGRSWRAAVVPDLTFPQEPDVRSSNTSLIPLDADHAVVQQLAVVQQQDRRWRTADGGRTWTPVDPTVVETVDEIPDGAHVIYVALAGGAQPNALVVNMIRLDGSSAVLVARPTADHPLNDPGVFTWTPDGSAWITPQTINSYPAFFHSRDRGHSWQPVTLPDGLPAEGRTYVFVPASGTTVYVTDHEAFRVWRSNDSGATWEEVTVGFDSAGAPVGPWEQGLPDGRLVAYKPVPIGSGRTRLEPYVITPTGSTFEPIDLAAIRATMTTSSFSPKPTTGPRPPWGVSAPDGTWTPLPFGCTRIFCS
jgi:hypothetical protein